MRFKTYRPYIAAAVIIATVAIFIYYIKHNPAIITELRHTNPWLVVLLLGFYAIFMVALILVQQATLSLSSLKIPARDNILLTIYSTVINFFGPLQSGPGFRGLYLKRRFGVSLKRYTIATLGYYVCFAFWSALFIAFAFDWRWWVAGIVIGLIVLGGGWLLFSKRLKSFMQGWQLGTLLVLLFATLFQLSVVAVIYYTELRSITPAVTLHQAIIYAGAANFSLFVSLTPGAIGFREAFVLFTQQLHHIPTTTILAATILDRAVYIILLIALFIVTLMMHVRDRLQPKAPQPSDPKVD